MSSNAENDAANTIPPVRWGRERTELFIAIMTEQYPKMLLNDDPSDDLPIWHDVDRLFRERIENEETGDDPQAFLSNISIRRLQKKWDKLIDRYIDYHSRNNIKGVGGTHPNITWPYFDAVGKATKDDRTVHPRYTIESLRPDGTNGTHVTILEIEDEPPQQQQQEADNTPTTRKRGRDDNDNDDDDDVMVPLSQVRRLLEESTGKQEQMFEDFLAKMEARNEEAHRMYLEKLLEVEDRHDREWKELMKRQDRCHKMHMDELERTISALEKCCQDAGIPIPPSKDIGDEDDSDKRDPTLSNNDKQ